MRGGLRSAGWVVTLLLVCLLLGACSSKDSGEVKIGLTGALSGDTAYWGTQLKVSAQIAVDEINEAGGVLGKRLKLVANDDRGNTTEAVDSAKRLITQDRVVGVIGHSYSSVCLALAPVAEQYKVPFIAPMASAEKVTIPEPGKVRPYYFRTGLSASAEGGAIATLITNKGFKKAAVISDIGQDYCTSIRDFFKTRFAAMGGSIVAEESIKTGEEDFRAILTRLAERDDIDIVVLTTYYKEAALLMKQARGLGMKHQFVGPASLESPELAKLGGAAVEGCYITTAFTLSRPDPKLSAFQQKFSKVAGFDPDASGAAAYDGVYLITEAIKQANSTKPEDIRNAMEKLPGTVAGLLGPIKIDQESHNAPCIPIAIQVRDGKSEFIAEVK